VQLVGEVLVLPAGILRERVVVEEPREHRNAMGESVQTWHTVGDRMASVEAISYSESVRRQQTGGDTSYTVRMRYFPGLTGAMRLRWVTRENRILWIAGLLERGNREEHEVTAEERG
jgi:head-tail adaptor